MVRDYGLSAQEVTEAAADRIKTKEVVITPVVVPPADLKLEVVGCGGLRRRGFTRAARVRFNFLRKEDRSIGRRKKLVAVEEEIW